MNINDLTRFSSSESEDELKSEQKVHSKRNKQNASCVDVFLSSIRFVVVIYGTNAHWTSEKEENIRQKENTQKTLYTGSDWQHCVSE